MDHVVLNKKLFEKLFNFYLMNLTRIDLTPTYFHS